MATAIAWVARDTLGVNLGSLTQHRSVRMLRATFDAWIEDKALRLSAALAYYSIFSIAPLLIIAISIAGLVLGEEAVRGQLQQQLDAYIGATAAESVQSMVRSAANRSSGWLGTIIGFATLMLGASGVFGQLKDALNTIWEVKVRPGTGVRGFLRERLLTFGMVLIIGFLLLTSLLLSTALAALSGYIERMIGMPAFVGGALGFAVSLAVVTLLFAFIFKVLPDAQVRWRNVWIGAAVTAFLFELGKFGLGYYLGRESTASSFGAAGSVVLLLLWVYYASCILLFGAEFTQVYARETGPGIRPAPNAVRVTAEARAQEGLAPEAVVEDKARPSEPLVPQVKPEPQEGHALAALFAATGAGFVIGLIARHRAEEPEEPMTHLRKGFAGLGEKTGETLAAIIERVRKNLDHRKS